MGMFDLMIIHTCRARFMLRNMEDVAGYISTEEAYVKCFNEAALSIMCWIHSGGKVNKTNDGLFQSNQIYWIYNPTQIVLNHPTIL